MLDFDFHKQCSISISTLNVYCCLVCGKYFQGKGQGTHAYMHSLQPSHSEAAESGTSNAAADSHYTEQHNMFLGLTGSTACRIYCLPDNYEVRDASLNDIKFNLKPVFTREMLAKLDESALLARSLDGSQFMPGCVGLNNLKLTDFANCVVQLLARVRPLRDFCLLSSEEEGTGTS